MSAGDKKKDTRKNSAKSVIRLITCLPLVPIRHISASEDIYLARLDKNPETSKKTYQNNKSEWNHVIPPPAFCAFSTD